MVFEFQTVGYTMRSKDVCALLGLHENTIRHYIKMLDLSVKKDASGRRIFDDTLVEILRKAKYHVSNEGTIENAKALLNQEIVAYNGDTVECKDCNDSSEYIPPPRIEIIQDAPHQNNEFALVVQPLMSRLDRALDRVENLQEEKAHLIARTQFLEMTNADLREKLAAVEAKQAMEARPWWKIFTK